MKDVYFQVVGYIKGSKKRNKDVRYINEFAEASEAFSKVYQLEKINYKDLFYVVRPVIKDIEQLTLFNN